MRDDRKNVRFIRVRGRVVPVRSKGKSAPKTRRQKTANFFEASSKVAGTASAASLGVFAAAVSRRNPLRRSLNSFLVRNRATIRPTAQKTIERILLAPPKINRFAVATGAAAGLLGVASKIIDPIGQLQEIKEDFTGG